MCNTMREDGVLPDVVTYSTVINACENARELDAALKVYEDMRLAGVPPNDYTFRSLIRCTPVSLAPAYALILRMHVDGRLTEGMSRTVRGIEYHGRWHPHSLMPS
jgi:pentatricopeptide repeat protein